MKLDRNINPDGRGKYALIKLRTAELRRQGDLILVSAKHVDFGDSPDTDFFVIRLKDKYAAAALHAYADAVFRDGQIEYGTEIEGLAYLADNHPHRRMPD